MPRRAPTVDQVLAGCHVGNGFYEWREEGGASRYDAATLRPALEEAYDPTMPDWPAMVDFDG